MQANLLFEEELTPKRGVKIPVGIHSNCEVTDLVIGDEYVDVNFAKGDLTHNKRLWAPKGKYPNKIKMEDGSTQLETVDQAIEREKRLNLSLLAALTNIFLTEDERASLKAELAKKPEYDDVVAVLVKRLNPVLSRKRVNLKLIPDSEGKYSKFGTYPSSYIEEYVEGAEPKLKYSVGFFRFYRVNFNHLNAI